MSAVLHAAGYVAMGLGGLLAYLVLAMWVGRLLARRGGGFE